MKGIYQVSITDLKKKKSRARDDLDAWVASVHNQELFEWVDTYIVEERISLTPKGGSNDNYLSASALAKLGRILTDISKKNSEDLPIREWKNIHLLYLNQFFVKTYKGKNGSLSLIMKQKSSITHLPEITFQSVTDFRYAVPIKRRFVQEREDEDELTEQVETFEQRKEIVEHHRMTLREAFENIKRKKAEARAAALLPTETICKKCGHELPEGSEKCVACSSKKKKRQDRTTYSIATLFLSDNLICPIYNEVTKKPWCNMLTDYTGDVIDPNDLTEDGIKKLVEFFKKHRSVYHFPHHDEFNQWIPFQFSFYDTRFDTHLMVGKDAYPYIKDIARECQIILNHVYSVFCCRNEYSFIQVMNFLAHAVQRPWENCNIMLNIQGPQGIGKSSVNIKKKRNFILTWLSPNFLFERLIVHLNLAK